jgi:hypothetical protein
MCRTNIEGFPSHGRVGLRINYFIPVFSSALCFPLYALYVELAPYLVDGFVVQSFGLSSVESLIHLHLERVMLKDASVTDSVTD